MKRPNTPKPKAPSTPNPPASGDREDPKKLYPEKGDFFLKVKKMLRHYAKHAPKKDETSEFTGGAFA